MHKSILAGALMTLALVCAVSAPAQSAPTVEQFQAVLVARLQKLKPDWAKERTVLFQSVKAGTPKSGAYPFLVTAQVHDYGTGFPANKYCGQTTVGTFEDERFILSEDDFGGWKVEGPLTPPKSVSKANPAEGVSAIPVNSLPGKPAANKPAPAPTGASPAKVVKLPMGEWASYGTGGQLLIGLGFILKADGTYTNLEGKEGGKYVHDTAAATVTFKGGFLDGEVGTNVKLSGFKLSNTISCEPYR